MKKKILYIYGYGSDENSTTRENLQTLLGPNYQVDSVNYDQGNPVKAIPFLENVAKDYDAVIGSSLGGFYTLKINAYIPKIVINPCMTPSYELPKIGCARDIADRFKAFEKTYKDNYLCLGLFGDHDELINYQEAFTKEVNSVKIIFSSGHRPSIGELDKVMPFIRTWIK